jgi:hypothetical protein
MRSLRPAAQSGGGALKRASYREAIDWIAQMDSAADDDALIAARVAELITSVLVADLFAVDEIKVGLDVVARRRKLQELKA